MCDERKIIDLMEKALSAYTDEHIQRYFNDVKENGLTEHGFPRLTANIGILIAHGRRKHRFLHPIVSGKQHRKGVATTAGFLVF